MSPPSPRALVARRVLDPGAWNRARPARAILLRGGRIERLLEADELDGLPTSALEDLGEVTLLPGLCDAHLHLAGLGRALQEVDLRGMRSVAEIAEAVAGVARQMPAGAWIRGRGWDEHRFVTEERPHRGALDDAAPGHPVWLARVDGHAAWLSSPALAAAGIDRHTPDPLGGRIERDASGNSTGVVVDNALELAGHALPRRDADAIRRALRIGAERCRALGLTSVHDMGTSDGALEALVALDQSGALPLRVVAYLSWSDDLRQCARTFGTQPSARVRVEGVKLYADGALGSHGAALEAPYTDLGGDERGLLLTEPDELRVRALVAARLGLGVAIHGIGDRGCRVALDAFAAVRSEGHGVRLRLEHAQILTPEILERMARLRVCASMQPTHATSDMGWAAALLGEARLTHAYAWRTVVDHGLLLALGSDAPIERPDPWAGVHAAITRQDAEGRPPGGWQPEQRLTLHEALLGFGAWAARAAGDARLGTLEPGAPADLVAIPGDLPSLRPGEILRLRPCESWLEGEPRG